MTDTKLHLSFHGRIIDHIGIQMYQSPTAALAEIVANSWDADATEVNIFFDFSSDEKSDWTITVSDNGNGMTKDECQEKFLNVGFNRREQDGPKATSLQRGRPLMGRKGIGKFAGFGIARFIEIDTVSQETKERTMFELDQEIIRQGDSYVSTDQLKIDATHDKNVAGKNCGTKVTLRNLELSRRIPEGQFRASLARRFLINSTADEFSVKVNGQIMSDDVDASSIEMSFPRDLPDDDKESRNVNIDDDGWGTEDIDEGKRVRWRVQFFKELVKDEELSGVTIFAHKKLAQRPFMFNVSGGLGSQAGPEYMSGQVVADWVDELTTEMISTERQRLRWEHPELKKLEGWGQNLIRRLLSIWKSKRTEEKMNYLKEKVGTFSDRLESLGSEGKPVRKAIKKLAEIEKLSKAQFEDMGDAVLLAWEGGRLKELIKEIAQADKMDEKEFMKILVEANVITALHTAETISAKLQAIKTLEQKIKQKDYEHVVRDHISENPWLISPKWETFAKEKRLASVCEKAGSTIYGEDSAFSQRIDLVLSSGNQLLVLEFMRPGITIDRDHLQRFDAYMDFLQGHITNNTGLPFNQLSGYIIADNQAAKRDIDVYIGRIESNKRYVMTWEDLIAKAKYEWREFLNHVKQRSPDDERLKSIREET